MPNDTPFELPLSPRATLVIADANDYVVARASSLRHRDRIILCVNAHDKLVAIARRSRKRCVRKKLWAERDGYDVLASSFADDIREIDAALADPASLADPKVLDAVVKGIAKEPGFEVNDES